MKGPAMILTTLMLFFTAQPFFVNCQAQIKPVSKMTGCCGGNACHKKEKTKKAENKDCDRTNACNPFAGCSGCQYVAITKLNYSLTVVRNADDKIITSPESIQSGFIANCFQPPECDFI